jgi:nicotinamidase-related amidase
MTLTTAAPRLDRERAALFVVDVQEAFSRAIPDYEEIARRCEILVRGFRRLGLPVVATVQYPKGLGPMAANIAEVLPEPPAEKLAFSGCEAPGVAERLAGRDQVVVCGIETHICVAQTAADLLEAGTEVHVAADAVSSRSSANRELALRRLTAAGAVETSVEMALFELLRAAGTPEFKDVQSLIR